MPVTNFDTSQYHASTNTDGTSATIKVNGSYIDAPTGGALIENVDPLSNIKIRVRRAPAPSAPGDTGKGALPDPERMRWTASNNTGANTSGGTVVTDPNRQIDTQFFKLEKKLVSDNSLVATIPCTCVGTLNTTSGLPAYIDLEFNPVVNGSSANELDRSAAYYYVVTLDESLPYKEYSDSEV